MLELFSVNANPFVQASLCQMSIISTHNSRLFHSLLSQSSQQEFFCLRAVQGDFQWPLKNDGKFHWSHEPTMHCDWGNPNLYLDQPITKWWCQSIRGHVSYPTDSPIVTKLGLCSSLTWQTIYQCMLVVVALAGVAGASSQRHPAPDFGPEDANK